MRPTAVIVFIQMILVLLCWMMDAGAFIYPTVGGVDLEYMSHAGLDELNLYFPRYYIVVYLVFLYVKYGVLLTFVAALVLWKDGRESFTSFIRWVFPAETTVAQLLLGLLAATIVVLVAYGSVRPLVNDPFLFQLFLARSYLLLSLATFSAWSILRFDRIHRHVADFLFEPQLPQVLAFFRIFFFGYLSLLYIREFMPLASNLGAINKVALPTIGWLVDLTPVSSELYTAICVIGAVFSLLSAIGLFTRVSMAINALAVFYVVATPNFFGKLEHHQLIIWIAWILAVSPCYSSFSIDAKRKALTDGLPNGQFGFPLKVIWLHFGLIYFFAGFHKLWLCGFDWALTDSMINQVRIEWFENYWTVSDWRLDRIPWLLKFGGLAVIYFELAFIFLILFRKLKWLAIFGGLAMHNVIGKLMFISFSQDLQAFYTAFIPWGRILSRNSLGQHNNSGGYRALSFSILLPLSLLFINVIYGILNISSYPFSVYPVYAQIIPPHVKSFEYRILDSGYENVNVWQEAKTARYNWERYARTEYQTIRNWQSGLGRDSSQVRTLWKRLSLEVPTVANVDSIEVYIVEHSLDPDSATVRISETYIMSIFP